MGGLQSVVDSWEGSSDYIQQHMQPLSMIIISGAGSSSANGVYALISEAKGGRPVWAKLGEPGFKISWSENLRCWNLSGVNAATLYSVLDCVAETFPTSPKWSVAGAGQHPIPVVSFQPLTNIIISGAGSEGVNGVYSPCPESSGGRPVWAQVGNLSYKIRWAADANMWVLDCEALGLAPYCIKGRKDQWFPRGEITWTSYVDGQAPVPSSHTRLRSNIIVTEAGISQANGLYVPCKDAHGGRPVWVQSKNPEYRMRWSKSFNVWILEYQMATALYCIENRSDYTPPASVDWVAFQGGEEPMPHIEYQAFCNIILSDASVQEVNGVYAPIDEAHDGRPVWSLLGNPDLKIQWSGSRKVWALHHAKGGEQYWCRDIHYLSTETTLDTKKANAQWIRAKTAMKSQKQAEEDPSDSAVCWSRGSRSARKLEKDALLAEKAGQVQSPRAGNRIRIENRASPTNVPPLNLMNHGVGQRSEEPRLSPRYQQDSPRGLSPRYQPDSPQRGYRSLQTSKDIEAASKHGQSNQSLQVVTLKDRLPGAQGEQVLLRSPLEISRELRGAGDLTPEMGDAGLIETPPPPQAAVQHGQHRVVPPSQIAQQEAANLRKRPAKVLKGERLEPFMAQHRSASPHVTPPLAQRTPPYQGSSASLPLSSPKLSSTTSLAHHSSGMIRRTSSMSGFSQSLSTSRSVGSTSPKHAGSLQLPMSASSAASSATLPPGSLSMSPKAGSYSSLSAAARLQSFSARSQPVIGNAPVNAVAPAKVLNTSPGINVHTKIVNSASSIPSHATPGVPGTQPRMHSVA
jgi:hypothetical protein